MNNSIRKPFRVTTEALTIAAIVFAIIDMALALSKGMVSVVAVILVPVFLVLAFVLYILGVKGNSFHAFFAASFFYCVALIAEIVKIAVAVGEANSIYATYAMPFFVIIFMLILACGALLIAGLIVLTVDNRRDARQAANPPKEKKQEVSKTIPDAEQLRQYHELYESGAITETEYNEIKSKILNK